MNPFLLNTYLSPEYFCDREVEIKTLIDNIQNQSDTAFFAQRRIGKTALIQQLFYFLRKKKTNCLYLDIYATQNLQEFTNQLANCIYSVFPPNKSIGKKFLEAIKLLRPVISFNDGTGSPQLSLDITQAKQFEKTIAQLLHFLDSQQVKTIIAFDEFQQILNYPEKNIEALLRTIIHELKNINFIFCGSNQKMMHTIFNSAKRPFYASTKNINLQKINPIIYGEFISSHFEKNKFFINNEVLDLILELTCNHTYYTQRFCHELYAEDQKDLTRESVQHTFNKILLENEGVYYQYRNLLTPSQWKLLKAIAVEEQTEHPFAQKFISTHKLGTPANVKRSIDSLLEKEMIYYQTAVEKPYYEVYDKFLMRWLQRK